MANKKPNTDNLINLGDRPLEERTAIAKAGGTASVEAKRKKKAMREQIELLLSLPTKSKKAQTKMQGMGIDPDNADNQMRLIVSMFERACTGDTFAATFLRDTVGEKPTDKHSVEVDTGLLDDIQKQLRE